MGPAGILRAHIVMLAQLDDAGFGPAEAGWLASEAHPSFYAAFAPKAEKSTHF